MMNKAEKHTSKIMQGLLEESSPVEMQQTRTKMRIAAKIDDSLQGRGWTRSKLARELGKSRSEITKWLSGTHNFTVDTLAEVCHVFEIDMASLFVKNEKHKSPSKRRSKHNFMKSQL
jgi:transcriptional regulator with XRE-family HTH domain